MNLNINTKNILIYSDSLAYGKIPHEEKRFPVNESFPGVMQGVLGSHYEVISEGLRGRTLVGENPLRPERNGLEQFGPIFGSHLPLDLVIIMLGTNDCNKSLVRSETEYCDALDAYLSKITDWSTSFSMPKPKVLIVAPPFMSTTGIAQDTVMTTLFGEEAEAKSKLFGPIYERFCTEKDVPFLDAGKVCAVDITEGVHLDKEGHRLIGEALAKEVLTILS